MEKKKIKAKKSTAKKVTELMELQNIVIGMHKKIQLIDNRTSTIESWIKKVRTRIGV